MELVCVQVQRPLLTTRRGRFASFFRETDCVEVVECLVAKLPHKGAEGCCTSFEQVECVVCMHPQFC